MPNIALPLSKLRSGMELQITGSKSETNRLLLLRALYPSLELENISNSDDSFIMLEALKNPKNEIDIHHAGTTMRFLTAYFSFFQKDEIILTGSQRMQERPIKILVEALQQLGADIQYTRNEGYPPLRIKGRNTHKNKVKINANISSQYISALLLIAPRLKNGLELTLIGEITSLPYIKMTLELLEEMGVETSFEKNVIIVRPMPQLLENKKITIESDWSSASYHYSLIALSEVGTEIILNSYKKNSLQGDSILAQIYKNFGVETDFYEHKIHLKKIQEKTISHFEYNLKKAPDIAQTIAVTCVGLGISCYLTGLHTLKIKETDRLEALRTELKKLGVSIEVSNEDLKIETQKEPLKPYINIDTYNDHRMAMAFVPLALCIPISINNAEVVSKSYPKFWNDIAQILEPKIL